MGFCKDKNNICKVPGAVPGTEEALAAIRKTKQTLGNQGLISFVYKVLNEYPFNWIQAGRDFEILTK